MVVNDANALPLLIAAGVLSIGLAAAQPIRIPDFRQGQEVAVRLKPGETCGNCGIIRAIREVQSQRPVPVPQAIQNDPTNRGGYGSDFAIGAVVALPIEPGRSYVGGVGTPEMRERFAETTYDVVVRLDNGGYTSLKRSDGARYQVGDRVRVKGNDMELIAQ
jgi:hypothetical protein